MLKKRTALIGFIHTCVMAAGSLALALVFGKNTALSAPSLFHVGVDVLGVFVCMVLFYGCMGQIEYATRSFGTLVVLTSISFAVNELMWFVSGAAQWRVLYFICCLLSKWINLVMICCFFQYVRTTLRLEEKLVQRCDKGFAVLLIASMLIMLATVFFSAEFLGGCQRGIRERTPVCSGGSLSDHRVGNDPRHGVFPMNRAHTIGCFQFRTGHPKRLHPHGRPG